MHIELSGEVRWLTTEGQRIVRKLGLNHDTRINFRRRLFRFHLASAQQPDSEFAQLMRGYLSYPRDLPDLSRLRPPINSNPGGIAQSHFERRKRCELEDIY